MNLQRTLWPRAAKALLEMLLASIILMTSPAANADKSLNLPVVSQRTPVQYDNWCWAASSQSILSFTGNAPGMCTVADYARQKNGWGNDDCCKNGTGAICNQPNNMYGSPGSIQGILDHYGAESDSFARSRTLKEVTKDIDDDSPTVVRWGWTAGGGHFVVIRGYAGSTMDVMNPWDGAQLLSYDNVVSTPARTWTHSLVVRPKKVTYVVDDTGSMGDDIDSVRNTLLAQINGYKAAGRFVKYHLITYKDNVTDHGSTTDPAVITNWVKALSASGGDDCEEAGYDALDKAAEVAPDSEIWWMTDAESHGGLAHMLLSQAKLFFAGNVLHSTILGSCYDSTSTTLATPLSVSGTPTSSQADRKAYNQADQTARRRANGSRLKPAGLTPSGDPDSFGAGQALAQATGGLYFAVDNLSLAGATQAITQEMASTALIRRLSLPSGSKTITVPVDSSLSTVRFLVDVQVGGTATLAVKKPDGTVLDTTMPGVTEILGGSSRMLVVTSPALVTGVYTVATTVDTPYMLSISGDSAYGAEIVGDATVGIGQTKAIVVRLSSLTPPTAPAGPGPDGPGGAMAKVNTAPPVRPFSTAALTFTFESEDGAPATAVTLYDDGLHGDGQPNDGVYGGSFTAPSSPARQRIVVSDGAGFQRVTKLMVTSGKVSVEGPDAAGTSSPGATISRTFTLRNLSANDQTFNLTSSSTSKWEQLSDLPATLSVKAGAATNVVMHVTVPSGTPNGQTSTLTLIAAAQSDASITGSLQFTTLAWSGPIISTLTPTSVDASKSRTVTLSGTGFGADPGSGSRASDANNVTLGGLRITAADVIAWSDTQIQANVPSESTGGLVVVTSGGTQSNPMQVVVVPAPVIVNDSSNSDTTASDNDGGGCTIGRGTADPTLPLMVVIAIALALRRRARKEQRANPPRMQKQQAAEEGPDSAAGD